MLSSFTLARSCIAFMYEVVTNTTLKENLVFKIDLLSNEMFPIFSPHGGSVLTSSQKWQEQNRTSLHPRWSCTQHITNQSAWAMTLLYLSWTDRPCSQGKFIPDLVNTHSDVDRLFAKRTFCFWRNMEFGHWKRPQTICFVFTQPHPLVSVLVSFFSLCLNWHQS